MRRPDTGHVRAGRPSAARVDKMLAAGRITADEAARLRSAAEPGAAAEIGVEIRRRHIREWLAGAIEHGRLTESEAVELLAAVDRGQDPRRILRLRGGRTSS